MKVRQFQLQVKTELEANVKVSQWFQETIASQLPQQFYWECQLILHEAFTNVVRHAHQNLPPTTPIDLEVILDNKML